MKILYNVLAVIGGLVIIGWMMNLLIVLIVYGATGRL